MTRRKILTVVVVRVGRGRHDRPLAQQAPRRTLHGATSVAGPWTLHEFISLSYIYEWISFKVVRMSGLQIIIAPQPDPSFDSTWTGWPRALLNESAGKIDTPWTRIGMIAWFAKYITCCTFAIRL